jgi:hypothetical protein
MGLQAGWLRSRRGSGSATDQARCPEVPRFERDEAIHRSTSWRLPSFQASPSRDGLRDAPGAKALTAAQVEETVHAQGYVNVGARALLTPGKELSQDAPLGRSIFGIHDGLMRLIIHAYC